MLLDVKDVSVVKAFFAAELLKIKGGSLRGDCNTKNN